MPSSAPVVPGQGKRGEVLLVVTGFGKFAGVYHNPTEQLVRRLQGAAGASSNGAASARRPHGPNGPLGSAVVHSCVLHVSAQAVDAWGAQLEAELVAASQAPAGAETVIFCHLGVDSREAQAFKLEHQAVNLAAFRCPDEAGWKPQDMPINPEASTTCALKSSLDLLKLEQLLQARGFAVQPSHNAGRFVCNYCYYRALQMCERQQAAGRNWHALFVHVPPFTVADEATQHSFLQALLASLDSCLPSLGE